MEKEFLENENNIVTTDENENFISEDEQFLDTFTNEEEELIDLTSEKIDELNKKLPSWSIEPPHKFIK